MAVDWSKFQPLDADTSADSNPPAPQPQRARADVDWSQFQPLEDNPRAGAGLDTLDAPAKPTPRTRQAKPAAEPAAKPEDGFFGNLGPALKQGATQTLKAAGKALEAGAVNLRETMLGPIRARLESGELTTPLSDDERAEIEAKLGRPLTARDTEIAENPLTLIFRAPGIAMEAAGKQTTAFADRVLAENPEWQRHPELANRPWTELLADKDTRGAYLGRAVGENAPNLAASLLASIGTGLLTRNPQAALSAAGMTSFSLESGFAFEELEELAGSKEDAARTAAAVGTVNALLDTVPIARLFEAVPGLRRAVGRTVTKQLATRPRWRRMLTEGVKQAGTEGSTEGLQEVMSNIGKAVYDEHQDLFEGVPEAMFIGSLLGKATGAMGGAMSAGPDPADQQAGEDAARVADELREDLARHRPTREEATPALADRSQDVEVDTRGTAATRGEREAFEASRQAPDAEFEALPAPRTVVDPQGRAGTEAAFEQFNRERAEMGYTPDVERAAAHRAEQDQAATDEPEAPRALPAPDPTVYVDPEGGAGTPSQRDAATRQQVEQEAEHEAMGLTPDIRRLQQQRQTDVPAETPPATPEPTQPAPAAAPDPVPPMASPADLRQQDFEARAHQQGLTDEQIEALRPTETPDAVTGFYKAEDRVPTIERAQAWTAETGQPAVYVEVDLANLGGLNAKLGHSGANEVYRAFADTIRQELEAIAPTAQLFRHGGDEMSAVVPGVDHDTVRAAMAEAQRKAAAIAQEQGLAELPHTKADRAPGVGLYFGTAEISDQRGLEDIFRTADQELEATKSEAPDVNREQAEPTGPAAPEGPARRAEPRTPETAGGLPQGGSPGPRAGATAPTASEEVTTAIEAAAAQAATSPANNLPEPTDAQKQAGNYKKGHLTLHGLDVAIENPRGSTRSGVDRGGRRWTQILNDHYGYIKRTEGRDGDHVDVFLGPQVADPDMPVFVIDQVSPGKGMRRFDEHKVVMGYPDEASARQAYLSNYEKGWKGEGGITRMTLDEFKQWLQTADLKKRAADTFGAKPARPRRSLKRQQPTERARPEGERIEDFGEVLHGARKHLWAGFRDRLDAVGDKEIAREPLSKIWPEPNYENLLQEGADPWTVAFVRAARDEIPAKPRASWKLRRWAEQVQLLRKVAKQLLDGDIAAGAVREKLNTAEYEQLARHLGGRIELYQAIGHAQSLKGVRLEKHAYSFYEGQRHDPPKTVWSVEKPAKASAFSNWPRTLATGDTKAEAIAAFKKNLAGIEVDKPAKKHVRFDLFGRGGKYFIGKKIRRHVIRLKEFDDLQAARDYLQNNQDQLVKLLARERDLPSMRGDENAPRVGIDHRNGADVTPQQFSEAFGFRGVQFGNWVEGSRRRRDLNAAYDALMDLAGVLNLPPRALSLNGELGLAFGARGKGGKGAGVAHYEPGTVVINLTKQGGPGSLAHEWWHALDNYFSRARKESAGYLTERPYEAGAGVRPEMVDAFNRISQALRTSGMMNRARELDKLRSADYWSTMREMSARAFEAYAVAKLQDQGLANDYLANITTPDVWGKAREAAKDFPYPFLDEMQAVREAYDNFFEVIETREESDGRVALFSRKGRSGSDRSAWGDFPDVLIATPLGTLRSHPRYAAAKAGDVQAALDLVRDIMPDTAIARIREQLGDRKPTIVPVSAEEATGRNKIPHAFAAVLANRLGLPFDTDIVQSVRANHTKADAFHRIAMQPVFDGKVDPGREYLIVDDAVTVGGTLANLRGHIEANGGKVIQAATLTGFGETATLPIQEKMLARLRNKHGDELEQFWQEEFGFGLDRLTQGEAGHLRKAPSVDEIRARITEARERAGDGPDGASPPDVRRRATETPRQARPRAGLAASEVDTAIRDLLRQWRNAPPIEVVQGERDLPALLWRELHRTGAEGQVNGVFDTHSGQIYLIADNLRSTQEAKKVLFHEALGHYGLRQLLGNELVPVLNQVYLKYGKKGLADIARREGLDLRNKEDRLIAAEEKLAHLAESGADPTLLQKLVAVIRNWLRKMGFQLELSYAEILEIVAKARGAVIHGRRGRSETRGRDQGAPVMASRARFHRSEAPEAFTDGFATPSPSLIDWVRYKLQDKYIDLRRVQEAIEETRGVIDDRLNTYMMEELYHGKAELAIEEARQATMEPFLEAIKSAGLTVEEAGRYLYARHAKERNARIQEINPKFQDGGGSGMTDAEADAILAQYRDNPKVARIGALADGITKKHRDLLVDAGLETAETVEAWEQMYDHYVPLKGRDDLDDTNIGPAKGKGFDVRGRTKRAFGRQTEAQNIVANLLAQYEADLIRAQKAEVGRSLLRLVEANPNPALWEIDKVALQPTINKATGLVQYRPDPRYVLADNVLVVKVDGIDHHITFKGDRGKQIAKAMKNLGAANVSGIVRALAAANRVLAMLNTSLNPEFIISNLMRDLQTAGINLAGTEADAVKGRIIQDVGKAWHGIRQAQKRRPSNPWAKHFEAFRRAGGKTGWIDAHSDVNRLHKQLESELKAFTRDPKDPRRLVRQLGDTIEAHNTAIENAVRLSAFVHARELGLSEAKAASLAKNLTVNFNRKGEWGPAMNALYLFYNASVQGNVRMLQALKSKNVRKIVGGIVVFAATLDLINRVLGGDDEDGVPKYDKIPPWVKERNLVLMNPWSKDGYVKIPLPWGYNVFHVLGQQLGEGVSAGLGLHDDFAASEAAVKVLEATAGAFNPLGSDATLGQFLSPTITDPIVSIETNKDWAGRPIRPGENPFAKAPKPDSQKYWNSTSEPARAITRELNELTGGSEVRPGWIDVSPTTLDYLFEFGTGGAGRFVKNSIDAPLKKLVDDDVETYQIPFLRKVYGEIGTQATQERFYRNLEQVHYADQEMKLAREQRDPALRTRVLQEQRPYLRARVMARSIEKKLRDLRERRDRVRASQLPEKVQRERVKRIEDRMENLMLRFNKRVRELQQD